MSGKGHLSLFIPGFIAGLFFFFFLNAWALAARVSHGVKVARSFMCTYLR